ncbi:MAG: DUF2232 domain-containing protein [Oscillatoriaceae cyanobacterium]
MIDSPHNDSDNQSGEIDKSPPPSNANNLSETAAEPPDASDYNYATTNLNPLTAGKFSPPKPALIMVETAFLASTSSLIWLINYYFPLGPVLRIFFPVPIALVYLRWGSRAANMGAVVSGLLLSVLMGPTRSVLFLIPFGVLGVLLGWLWRLGANWNFSIIMGTLIGSLGFFFRLWLLSIMLGEDLWVYLTTQMTELAEWIFLKMGWLAQPELYLIQIMVIILVLLNNLIYLFAVHLVAALLLERVGNPIPAPPKWVEILLEEE